MTEHERNHEPSVIKEGGYQGSSDPGRPTQLMQQQLRPAQTPANGASQNGAAPTQSQGGNDGD